MAFENVKISSAIWKNSGLRYVLMPHMVQGVHVQARSIPIASRPPTPGLQLRQSPGASSPPQPQTDFRHYQQSAPAQPSAQTLPPKLPQAFRPLPPEAWPEIWQFQLHKTSPGLFAWTYWHLGEDLLAGKKTQPDDISAKERATRSGIMRNILHELAHPAGTHTFWPPYLDASAQTSPILFWSGLHSLGCRGVIIFGSQAARFLIPRPGLKPLQQLRENGFQVWIMRDLAALSQSHEEYSRALAFLKRMLQIFIRR